MGICLDTEQQNGSQVFEEGDARGAGRWRGEAGLLATPPDGQFPMQNIGPVKFESPNVPVIFILGGPGSGKVTHCDNLIQENKNITHINMTDLLQQYAMGNDMQDFGLLSSKTVTEVLMLEIKMSPAAKTFLISGYPRNMRDVVEYSEKIQTVNGVILVSWRQEVLERQIDYGAQLGHVILGLARMELHNFYRNVMPVAEYFDQSGMLIAVNGERNPNEVYVDFKEAVMRILGISGNEKSNRQIPGSVEAEVEVERTEVPNSPAMKQIVVAEMSPTPEATNFNPSKTADKQRKGLPAFIWVIGGPGSNKATLCSLAVAEMPRWAHVSIGGLLRSMASTNTTVKDAIFAGEMVPHEIVMQLVEQQILLNRDTDGVVMDGFPRNLNQVQEFESKFGQEPPLILLDCSKLQLGRGRLDDSVSAFRRRLDLFREVSLPMLKSLDNVNRLTIIDGDTNALIVQEEFTATLHQHAQRSRRKGEEDPRGPNTSSEGHPNFLAPGNINGGSIINHDDVVPTGVAKIAKTLANTVDKTLPNTVDKTLPNTVDKALPKNVKHQIRNDMGNVTRTVNEVTGNGVRKMGNAMNNATNGINGRAVNGINSISKKVQDLGGQGIGQIANGGAKVANEGAKVVNGGVKVANGVLNNAKHTLANGGAALQNGGVVLQNGVANGVANGGQMLQNGIGNLANGIPTNKVAPIRSFMSNNVRDPVRNMYNEVEGYQQNLHI